ncbi:aldose 1-epimerase [Sphingomonas sp. MAH-20]|uniref:Aldose 1-epimerase n=1 Tax=Sphingomonas horti TaxID=2682842 RepID=A0A6I4J148_9SPHN|nr:MULTISPECIES: aldose 1-epimerase [Sphingomonas]MBA2919817.1 aldose 1-epimerase [Sphingomonas sp. CGMCC 1.13658]MVO78057.1 aldose 1-epimerase [Sphingomonas horti]
MIAIRAADYELVLAPGIGGAIASFTHGGAPVLRGADAPNSPLDCGCFPLVPYCNRIRGGRFDFRGRTVEIAPNMKGDPSPLHGQGWLGPWLVESQARDTACLFFAHKPGEWPWACEARQTFRLSEDGLDAEIECRNLSGEPMPCGLGFHPYYPCDSGTRIDTRVETVWEVDEKVLPTGTAPATGRYALGGTPACGRNLDNGYGGWDGEMRLTDGERVRRMTSPDARFFQIYSPPQGGLLAAEPVSHANAALNEPEDRWPDLGLRVLEPGQSMRLRMSLCVERL